MIYSDIEQYHQLEKYTEWTSLVQGRNIVGLWKKDHTMMVIWCLQLQLDDNTINMIQTTVVSSPWCQIYYLICITGWNGQLTSHSFFVNLITQRRKKTPCQYIVLWRPNLPCPYPLASSFQESSTYSCRTSLQFLHECCASISRMAFGVHCQLF